MNVSFLIGLHLKDKALLELIQAFFGGIGKIRVNENAVYYDISSVKDLLSVVIPHFEKYLLHTQKLADFLLFQEVVKLMGNKQHLTQSGLLQIFGIKTNLNKGINNSMIKGFVPVDQPTVALPEALDPNWISEFTSGDGGFFVSLSEAPDYKLGYRVRVSFEIAQDIRDIKLMGFIAQWFGCGSVYLSGTMCKFSLGSFIYIRDIIRPFFSKHNVLGVKSFNFAD